MEISGSLPTIFASTLGEKSGLLIERKQNMDHDRFNELVERMTYFQQMAVTSSFEDCVLVYYGSKISTKKDEDLTKHHLEILRLIYRTTKPWMKGHIVGVCLEKIASGKSANKDFAESVRVLIEQLEETGNNTGKKMGILVKSTLTEKANKKAAKKR